ncbi:response regulator transcription factor [Gorillibacterium massiliense]|uniref:response regulator transcription factor n=1 Tax=Gorillibacterium massiliense TaxID=1280390 RepID=UPI0004B6AA67|nr:response regulator [Gorillibacterium massiliense]
MYSLLIVDDEKYAVKGLIAGFDWPSLNITRIIESFDVAQAKELLQNQSVDLAILDIEMPGANGLELADWMHSQNYQTEIIFLTGHANFAYAQKAMQLGTFRYLLKPVNYDEMRNVIAEAVEKLRVDRENSDFRETYKKYYELWETQKPLLIERFWQDLISERASLSPENLEAGFRRLDLPLQVESKLLPVLISVEQWREPLSSRDEDIMEYAVRKAAEELVVAYNPGITLAERNGSGLILFYLGDAVIPPEDLEARCRQFIYSCNEYFHCQLSCYIGETTPLRSIAKAYSTLLQAEKENVSRTNQVVLANDVIPSPAKPASLPDFDEWLTLMEAAQLDILANKIEHYFSQLAEAEPQAETLEALYFGFVHIVYQAARRKGFSVHQWLVGVDVRNQNQPFKSVQQLKKWTESVVERGVSLLGAGGYGHSSVIKRVAQYVEEHIREDISREEVAASVYLNPAYLSRLFRKETGESLSDYIMKEKIDLAKNMLAYSNEKVSSVAEALGYSHFSYFAKIFRRSTGMSPQEYRKMYREFPAE